MSLSAKYQAFLARPSSGALAENASLHYITTLTSINTAPAIVKHFSVQEKLLKKRGEKVLNAIESSNAVSLEMETTIQFLNGGGAYLPGLDDNFIADRTVTFPTIHMVQFDAEQKISQIRLHWEQGSLLKQIDVIGGRARNWPIRDGKDQARLIATSAATVAQPSGSTASSRRSTASTGPHDVTITERPASSRSATSNAMNDPHATLNLFQPREIEHENSSYAQPIAPRAQSAKPPPREYSELFVGDDSKSPTPSPQKERIPTKGGGGTNYRPSRLFQEDEEPAAKSLGVKTNAKKYNHFEFGDGDDSSTPKAQDPSRPPTKTKHMSQWDFEDFATPAKTKTKILPAAVRHFGWSDDENEPSPVKLPIVHKPRPDADAQFEFRDDGGSTEQPKHVTSKGRLHNKGLGLYKDHILHSTSDDEDDENAHAGDVKRPLGDVTTHVKNENRQKDFGNHWEMRDDNSPATQKAIKENGDSKPIAQDRKKVLQSLDAHWGLYEESPSQAKKENVNTGPGIKTSGNGMGGRKGTNSNWMFGAEEEDAKTKTKPKPGQPADTKSFWDF